MPKENRKRGRKYKKTAVEDNPGRIDDVPEASISPEQVQDQPGPSWIVSAPETEEINREAPFGYVDPDVKAYFRTVDVQIREWQDQRAVADVQGDIDIDPNEERRLFFVAALTEMSGKERELATDPDCSSILERMTHSMDDFVRRVFVDSMMGSYEELVKHRFASHVCQTLFAVATDSISREVRGIFPPVPDSPDKGELRTLTQLIPEICDELLPTFTSLIMDPFASHVLRALLLLLCPGLFPSEASTSKAAVRSKKSAAWKSKQGPMKSVFAEDNDNRSAASAGSRSVPPEFRVTAVKFVDVLRTELGENEVRALAAHKVASPVLQMLLEIEAEFDMADEPNSLMDRVLVGMITSFHRDPLAMPEPSDFINTLLRDPTSSHLLETIVSRVPEPVFNIIWSTYLRPKLGRLALHPVANFVVAKAIDKSNAQQIAECCDALETDDVLKKIVKTARLGVFKAMVDRASVLSERAEDVNEVICKAFELGSAEDRKFVVSCVLRLMPLQEYKSIVLIPDTTADDHDANTMVGKKSSHGKEFKKDVKRGDDALEPKIQGALLLQSMLRLPEPHYQLVLGSIQALSMHDLIALSHNSVSSHVLDALLESPTISSTIKRKFLMSLIGHFHLLVDDRIGSRVADRCWATADPYLKEKIARSLIPHEQFLAASYYGKFFARNLRLPLLQRKPEEWKALQSNVQSKSATTAPKTESSMRPPTDTGPVKEPSKRKRDSRPEDEMDHIFEKSVGKKLKTGAPFRTAAPESLGVKIAKRMVQPGKAEEDRVLEDVLGAIRSAPKDDKNHRKKKRTQTKQ